MEFIKEFTPQKDFFSWLEDHRQEISAALDDCGGAMIAGTSLAGRDDFKKAVLLFNANIMEYTGAKVRVELGDKIVYSPTSTPPERINFLHHEMAYQNVIPSGLAFMCEKPADQGGESLLGDSRILYKNIRREVRDEIEKRKLKFQRVLINRSSLQQFLSQNFDVFALMPSWQVNYNTEDKAQAEAQANAAGHDVEWISGDHMILSTIVDPVKFHPKTGDPMWVNSAHLFQLHKSVFGSKLYYLFKTYFAITKRPMTTSFYGDGAKIPPQHIDEILSATFATQQRVSLKKGDLIFINNKTITHGRLPFKGKRKLFFAMYK